ncbi:MAG TPA: cytochrome P460 family protein [Candidatus Binatia bacterium]
MKIALLGLVMMSLMVACATVVGPDNASFPTGYRKQTLIATVDRADNKQVRDIYVSAEAAKMAWAGNPLPTGSVFTMEIYQAKADAKGDFA